MKYRFLVVLGDGPALLGMPDIKLQHILKITCKAIGHPHESRKFDSQTIEASDSPSCKTNKAQQI